MARMLVEAGADIEAKDKDGGWREEARVRDEARRPLRLGLQRDEDAAGRGWGGEDTGVRG
eukprot:466851-Rhodomonas_salina.1